jgi:hypothetical protein
MRVLVTGGAGFIGSAVCRHLVINEGWDVLNIDKLTYTANLHSLKEVSTLPAYSFVRADICDRQMLDGLFQNFAPDRVLHLAAESHVDRSITADVERTPRKRAAGLRRWSPCPRLALCRRPRARARPRADQGTLRTALQYRRPQRADKSASRPCHLRYPRRAHAGCDAPPRSRAICRRSAGSRFALCHRSKQDRKRAWLACPGIVRHRAAKDRPLVRQ